VPADGRRGRVTGGRRKEGDAGVPRLDELLARLERDRDRHMLSPGAAADFDVVEREIGTRLPAPIRRLLEMLGGGILYERHELFGTRRLMIHDIELVPDLLSVRGQLRRRPEGLPANLLPIHRCEGVLHHVDVSQPEVAPIVRDDGTRHYPDLAAFLEDTLLADAPRS
jgi:hypothetical protein